MNITEYFESVRLLLDKRIREIAETLHFSKLMLRQIEGGKRLRGTLTLLTCETLGGDIKKALDYAAAVEIVHAATLTHDDYIDRHKIRRGLKPLYTILDPRRAVLIGDMLMAAAIKYVSAEDGSKDALSDAIYDISRGAFLEPLNPIVFLKSLMSGKVLQESYLVIIKLKTAVLFATASKLGAIAAKSSMKEEAYKYGMAVGEAFQVADDLSDITKIIRNEEVDLGTLITLGPLVTYFVGIKETVPLIMNGFIKLRDKNYRFQPEIIKILEQAQKNALQFINDRLKIAKKNLDNFPENNYTNLLREYPNYAIEKMLEESNINLQKPNNIPQL
ncbi:MAG: polyprenyl synthetase family protein [Thermoprotei archaeon]